MSESPATTGSAPQDGDAGRRGSGLFRGLAWVGIIAGVVFTVAVIFFSGFLLGRASDGHKGWQRGHHGVHSGPGQGGCPMMRPGSMMSPGDMGPGEMRPGMMQPGQPTPAPAGPPPQR